MEPRWASLVDGGACVKHSESGIEIHADRNHRYHPVFFYIQASIWVDGLVQESSRGGTSQIGSMLLASRPECSSR